MDNNQIVFSQDDTKRTLQDNNKTNGILESTGVAIQKPNANFYCRCKPGTKIEDFVIVEVAFYMDPKTQKETQYILKGKDTETHRQLLNVFNKISKPSILVPYQDSGGNESLWVNKMAGKGQNTTVAHTTSLRAIQGMLDGWRCVYFGNLKTGWQCEKPDTQDSFEDYEFKEYTHSQLINFAFGDNILQDLDNDIVKIMKGMKL